MKALSLKQPWTGYVASKQKSIETRTWRTSYRGELLICSSLKADKRFSLIDYNHNLCHISGMAICVVDLIDCIPFEKKHEKDAMCEVYEGYAWIIENVRLIKPLSIKGQLSIFNVSDDILNQLEKGSTFCIGSLHETN